MCFQAHLALYCFANHQISTALRLMYRARYLALLCHGDNHPEVALFDVSSKQSIICARSIVVKQEFISVSGLV